MVGASFCQGLGAAHASNGARVKAAAVVRPAKVEKKVRTEDRLKGSHAQ
jgi:hypothetical protein